MPTLKSRRVFWLILLTAASLSLMTAINCKSNAGAPQPAAPGAPPAAGNFHISASAAPGGDGSAAKPFNSLGSLPAELPAGTVVTIDSGHGPDSASLSGDLVVNNAKGTADKPVVIRFGGKVPAAVHGRLSIGSDTPGAALPQYVVVENLAFEAMPEARANRASLATIRGSHIELRNCSFRGAFGDGLVVWGDVVMRGGAISSCDGWAAMFVAGETKLDGVRIESCGGGLKVSGAATVANSLLLHNRGPAVQADDKAAIKLYNNLAYDNSGGFLLDKAAPAEVVNNILVNNYAATLLSDNDVELAVAAGAKVNNNVYFRHPGKDKLLRGLPYASGVDLAPLGQDNPLGLRLRTGGKVVFSLKDPAWSAFDKDSQSLDIVQRFNGENSYTRSYEDLFADFQKEDFHPRFTSPAVGRGLSLPEVASDIEGKPRLAGHGDVGPYASPADWWKEIDSGKATIVDGTAPLDADGRDTGLGTMEKPFATLAKAAAFARWSAKIFIKDSIYRHTAIQTTFSLGPDAVISGFPGHRPAFSPSEAIAPSRWQKVSDAGLYRVRDWHTFLGYGSRGDSWIADWWGNSHIGGPDANVSSLSRGSAKLAEPFRPVRYVMLDRDTPQVLADGIALQPAGGVLGMEDFGIGTNSSWGRDPSHLRPGSFIVGRRDLLMSKCVGTPPLADGQCYIEGPNKTPEMYMRVNGKSAGLVTRFIAQPAAAWRAVYTYPTGDKLWQLDAATIGKLGKSETLVLKDGWVKIRADKDSAWWVRQLALPVIGLNLSGAAMSRQQAGTPHEQLPLNGYLQRQFPTGDAALAKVLENPYQDYLEVRLPLAADPSAAGISAEVFNARIEGLWRATTQGEGPSIMKPGAIMLSANRVMEACTKPEDTAGTARENWDFGFLVPMGASAPALQMRMPGQVNPNADDFWRFTVVDDSLYVYLPGGEDPSKHVIDAACNAGGYCLGAPGGNSTHMDWQEVAPLRPDLPAAKVYRTELDFGSNELEPLWYEGHPGFGVQGFEIDASDPSGRTIRLLDAVRLDAPNLGGPGEKVLSFKYNEGDAAKPAVREFHISSKQLTPDRRIVLPSKPLSFDARYVFNIAPADKPTQIVEQLIGITPRVVKSRGELAPGTCFYDAAEHYFYICPPAGSLTEAGGWSGARYEPLAMLRGLYLLGGNSYGHQKQYGWGGTAMGVPSMLFEDDTAGFSTVGCFSTEAGSVVRNCLFRWAQVNVGRGGPVSGDVRHTANRIKKPELHVDHCVFDINNSFIFDGNDNPTKNIPFGNHHIWENSYFLTAMCGGEGPWWDQFCFNNVVQNNIFTGMGGADCECCENLIVRNNIFAGDKKSVVTYRGSDHGYAINNTAFRGGGIWFDSEPTRANATEQGQPCYGETFDVLHRGRVPWMMNSELGHETGLNLAVQWLAAPDRPEVYYCENWDFATPLLIDAEGFKDYTGVSSLSAVKRGTYYHDTAAKRLYVCSPEGKKLQSSMPAPHIPQSDDPRRSLMYTLTVTRAGRLSIPFREAAPGELEILEPVKPGQTVRAIYFDDKGNRKEDTVAVTAETATAGLARLKLSAKPADDRLFVGLAGEEPPKVRVTGSQGPNPRPGLLNDVKPFEAELMPGSTIVASTVMGMKFNVLRGFFDAVKAGDQFESVFQSRSVYHFAALDNLWIDFRSWDPSDRCGHPCHGIDYMVNTEQTDASLSQIDYDCFWKDLHAVPGPLSASINWGRLLFSNMSGAQEGATLGEFTKATGYESHAIAPPGYFTLIANPLRYDVRPLPDSPVLGAGLPTKQQVGDFLFDPDEGNGHQTFTYKGNQKDIFGADRGDKPTIGAAENPLPGARAWYMAPDGADAAGRGAKDAPLATAAYALDRMRPGDVLVIRSGTYKQAIVIDRSGTSENFLHIVAEAPPYPTPPKFPTPGPAVIDAAALGDQPAILLKNCGHVRLAGLKVTHSAAKAAVELRQTRDCVLEYIFVEKPAQTGIAITGRENTLYECSVTGGRAGYAYSGSLCDIKWCASEGSASGFAPPDPGAVSAGLYLFENRHLAATKSADTVGFALAPGGSDNVFDGNYASGAATGFGVAGARTLLVNNVATGDDVGVAVKAADLRLFNNSMLSCKESALKIAGANSVLALNNVFQSDKLCVDAPADRNVVLDYGVYAAAPAATFKADNKPLSDLAAWSAATGNDRNSTVAPLTYGKFRDPNGRWRIRPDLVQVSNQTGGYNAPFEGHNSAAYKGGGDWVFDVPADWKLQGDATRGLYAFDPSANPGAVAAYAYWYVAKLDYLAKDGKRKEADLVKIDLPPDQLPAGTFCQDPAAGKLFFRLPADAKVACPIGSHRKLSPTDAVGCYVGRNMKDGKYFNKVVTPELAKAMDAEGLKEVDAVENVLTGMCGTAGIQKGCPIAGFSHDADNGARPTSSASQAALGWYNGPGRFDIGSWQHGCWID